VRPVVLPRGLKVWLSRANADVRAALADPRLRKDSARSTTCSTCTPTDPQTFRGGESLFGHMLTATRPTTNGCGAW